MLSSEGLLLLYKKVVQKQAEKYGPAFLRSVARNSVAFLSTRLGQKAPKAKSIDEAVEYVKRGLERDPKGVNAFTYGMVKALIQHEATVGADPAVSAKPVIKFVLGEMGLDQFAGEASETLDALNKLFEILRGLNVVTAFSFVSANAEVTGCTFGDGCRTIIEEGVLKTAGRMECLWGANISAITESMTKATHDYELAKLDPPNCEIRIFKRKQSDSTVPDS